MNWLPLIREKGLEFIEIDANHAQSFPYNDRGFVEAYRRELLRLGLLVNSIHTPFHYCISDPNPDNRKQAVYEIQQLMENCVSLADCAPGGLYLVIHPGHHLSETPAEVQLNLCVKSLEEILENKNAGYYRICIENMLSSHFGGKSEELKEVINRTGSGRVFICLDTSHSVYDSNPCHFFDETEPYLATTHISDNYHQGRGEFHGIPMTLRHSDIDWPSLINRLSKKMERIIYEIHRPHFIDNDIFLDMVTAANRQFDRMIV